MEGGGAVGERTVGELVAGDEPHEGVVELDDGGGRVAGLVRYTVDEPVGAHLAVAVLVDLEAVPELGAVEEVGVELGRGGVVGVVLGVVEGQAVGEGAGALADRPGQFHADHDELALWGGPGADRAGDSVFAVSAPHGNADAFISRSHALVDQADDRRPHLVDL